MNSLHDDICSIVRSRLDRHCIYSSLTTKAPKNTFAIDIDIDYDLVIKHHSFLINLANLVTYSISSEERTSTRNRIVLIISPEQHRLIKEKIGSNEIDRIHFSRLMYFLTGDFTDGDQECNYRIDTLIRLKMENHRYRETLKIGTVILSFAAIGYLIKTIFFETK